MITLPNLSHVDLPKLGKHLPKKNVKSVPFSKYLLSGLPAAPDSFGWDTDVKVPWGMYDNDQIGDCTFAAIAHYIMAWTAATGRLFVPTVASIVAAYSALTGYNPATGLNDNGAAETDVLEFWQTKGVAGHQILGWATIDPTNIAHVKLAIWMFGGVYTGVELPVCVQNQSQWVKPADLNGNNAPGSWGGHAVPSFKYDANTVPVITWGNELPVDWDFFTTFFSEVHVPISQDFFTNGKAPSGFDIATMEQDIKGL